MDAGLKGKVVLVTGGGRDVGRAISLAFAREGANVAVNYNSSAQEAEGVAAEVRQAGAEARVYQSDVGDYAAVQRMVGEVMRDFGRIDVLVNNAGYTRRQRFVDTAPEDWKRQIDVGLYGVIHTCHAVLPHMLKQNGGRIVNFTGDSARVGENGLAVTAASRGGVLALTKSLAREVGRANITVNAISLGLIETPHDAKWVDENREKLVRLYPMRRLGKTDDVAPMVVFLGSANASWVTGQIISVNGGFSMS
jgi:NAD(P)-dependent dehydrogenase (short-subunit alcohol dehydrogenase family)